MISRGIVIKKTDVGEDNQLITFYTQDFGKLTGIAKSIKKATSKQASHLELFNLSDFRLVTGRVQLIVASAQSLETFTFLKASLNRLAAGFFLLETFNRLIYDHEHDTALWNFLEEALNGLNRIDLAEEAVGEYLAQSKEKFLKVLGYEQPWGKKEAHLFLESLGQRRFFSADFAEL